MGEHDDHSVAGVAEGEGGAMTTLGVLERVRLAGVLGSVPAARHYVRDLRGVAEHPRVDDILLLVTELVANSVRHSDSGRRPGGGVTMIVAFHDGTLHVDVIDA